MTSIFDIRTLFLVLFIVCFALSIDLIFLWLRNRSVAGPKYWAAAMIFATVGSLCYIVRGFVPLFSSVFFSTIFTLGGYALFLRGIRAFFKIRHGAALEWGAVGFSACYSTYFTLVSPCLVARIVLFSLVAALLLFRCAYLLFQRSPAGKEAIHSFATASTFLLAVISSLRAVLAIFGIGIPNTESFLDPNLVTVVALLSVITTYISLSIGLTSLPGQFAMKELRASEERFRRLTEESADIVWQLDTDLNFTYVNGVDQVLRGFSPDNVLGTSIWDAMPPDDAERVCAFQRERLTQERQGIKTGAQRYEVRLFRKDGGTLWTELHASPLRDSNEQISGYIGITRDISDRKRDEDLKEKVLRDQTNFLQMVSHEYRTPLAIMQANIDLLDMAGNETTETQQLRLVNMRQAVGRLKEVMETSLQAARFSELQLDQEPEVLELVSSLDSILDHAEGLWPDRTFVFQPEDGEKMISGYPSELKTALLNLLDNACKYSPAESPIMIGLTTEGDWGVVQIRNVGQTVRPDEVASLFEKFQRGSGSSGSSGAGLGLWLVQQIADLHGGTVTAQLNAGEEFSVSIRLPLFDKV